MKQFENTFTDMDDILEKRGFTLYEGDEPCYIARMFPGMYVVITSDLEIVEIWDCTGFNTQVQEFDEYFADVMTGSDTYEYAELRDNSKVVKRDLAWALGFN